MGYVGSRLGTSMECVEQTIRNEIGVFQRVPKERQKRAGCGFYQDREHSVNTARVFAKCFVFGSHD